LIQINNFFAYKVTVAEYAGRISRCIVGCQDAQKNTHEIEKEPILMWHTKDTGK